MKRHRWTDDEIVASAAKYQHKGDWKRSADARDSAAYQSALNRPEIFKRATAHMIAKASPYAGDYVIYVFEFTDRHVYVGLTFRPAERLMAHLLRGPVFDHIAGCGGYTHKHVTTGIASPAEAVKLEQYWIERYKATGWTLLNTASGGGLGTVLRVKEWTKELVLAEAAKFKTKQEWIDGSQGTYRIAKREGWFDEASAHMPARKLGVGLGLKRSADARRKMRAAKTGGTLSAEHRDKIATSVTARWAARRS